MLAHPERPRAELRCPAEGSTAPGLPGLAAPEGRSVLGSAFKRPRESQENQRERTGRDCTAGGRGKGGRKGMG